ncbi:MAG: cytochrome c-type biogenesis protein [Xanthobacteraceae bacterium]|jgi:cytochrome c-type biogenesis protein CcmH
MQMKLLCLVMTLLTFVAVPCAIAVEPGEVLSDPALEARARALSKELRCMVCQNQSIDDSEAPLARDLRMLVRERLQAGESDRHVIDFLVARYGEFVLLRPRFSWHTALLWLGPAAMLVIGACGIIVLARRYRANFHRAITEQDKLTAAEAARLSDILRSGER